MGDAVDTSRSNIDVPQEDLHPKELEDNNKSALALVRKMLRDSSVISMEVRTLDGVLLKLI